MSTLASLYQPVRDSIEAARQERLSGRTGLEWDSYSAVAGPHERMLTTLALLERTESAPERLALYRRGLRDQLVGELGRLGVRGHEAAGHPLHEARFAAAGQAT